MGLIAAPIRLVNTPVGATSVAPLAFLSADNLGVLNKRLGGGFRHALNMEVSHMTLIYSYTRAQAIEDGVLIDVSKMAREAGIKHPTALTARVWARCVQAPADVPGQDEEGRLWDILWCFRWAVARQASGTTNELSFQVGIQNDADRAPELVRLKVHCGPGDNPEPVITIMFPDED